MPTCWDTGLTDLCPARTSMDTQYTLELGHHLPTGLELAHPYPLPSLSGHKDPSMFHHASQTSEPCHLSPFMGQVKMTVPAV